MSAFNPVTDDYDEPCCPDCGSSMGYEDCPECGGDGYVYDWDASWPDENRTCGLCDGTGGWWLCLSSREYCERVKAEREAAGTS